MNRSLYALGIAASCVAIAPLAAAEPRALPSLPGSPPGAASDGPSDGDAAPANSARAAAPSGSPAGSTSLSPQRLYEHVRRGVVAVLRNGSPVAVGTVLAGDGRILTSLSGIGGVESPDVRYADGTTVHTRVGRADKALDLALLVPESNTWAEGLSASEADPRGLDVRAMLPARGAGLGPSMAALKGRTDAHARGGEPLLHMLDVDVQGVPLSGAPVLDSTGSVVAVLVRACKGPAAGESSKSLADGANAAGAGAVSVCRPVILGAPVAAIRSFLVGDARTSASVAEARGERGAAREPVATAPAVEASSAAPWLGIRGEPEESGPVRGVRIDAVAPSSPADKAGLKASRDIIVAVDAQPIATPQALSERIGQHAAGDTVKLLVFGNGAFREVTVVLRSSGAGH